MGVLLVAGTGTGALAVDGTGTGVLTLVGTGTGTLVPAPEGTGTGVLLDGTGMGVQSGQVGDGDGDGWRVVDVGEGPAGAGAAAPLGTGTGLAALVGTGVGVAHPGPPATPWVTARCFEAESSLVAVGQQASPLCPPVCDAAGSEHARAGTLLRLAIRGSQADAVRPARLTGAVGEPLTRAGPRPPEISRQPHTLYLVQENVRRRSHCTGQCSGPPVVAVYAVALNVSQPGDRSENVFLRASA